MRWGVACPNLVHKFSDKLENRCWKFCIFLSLFSLSLSGFYHTNTRSKSIVSVRCVRRISIWNVDKPQVATKQEIQCEKRETTSTNTQSTNINQSQSSMMQKRKKQKRNFSRSIIFIYPTGYITMDVLLLLRANQPYERRASEFWLSVLVLSQSHYALGIFLSHVPLYTELRHRDKAYAESNVFSICEKF